MASLRTAANASFGYLRLAALLADNVPLWMLIMVSIVSCVTVRNLLLRVFWAGVVVGYSTSSSGILVTLGDVAPFVVSFDTPSTSPYHLGWNAGFVVTLLILIIR